MQPIISYTNNYKPMLCLAPKEGQQTDIGFSPSFGHNAISFNTRHILPKSDKELNKLVKTAIKNKCNKIGAGEEGNVYKIPNTLYCLKIPKQANLIADKEVSESRLNLKNEKWNFSISKKDKINYIVAKSINGKTIMKHIKGEPLTPYMKQKEIYDLPDSSYIDFLKQIQNAKLNGRGFDSNHRNIIYNKKKKTLTIIDFYDQNDSFWKTVNSCQAPLKDTFRALKSRSQNNAETEAINRKLGNRLLNITVDELFNKKDLDFDINEKDTSILIEQIMLSQDYKVNVELLDLLKNIINDMIELHKNFNGNRQKLNIMNKLSKEIINEELPC